jgi:hypothetical protein
MELNKNELEIIQHAIKEWEQDAKLSPQQANELRNSLSLKRSERQLLAKYFFIISISCALLAFGAIFLDEKLLEKLKLYFSLSNIIIAAITAIISVAWFWYVFKRRNRLSAFTYEIYMILGALCSLSSLVYTFKDVSTDSSHIALLISASLLLFLLAALLRSLALWGCGIIALTMWFGAFSGNLSRNNLFLGMNLALRYTAYGLLMLSVSFIQTYIKPLSFSQRITFGAGLLIFLLAMWGVSVFGNYNTLDEWWKVRQSHEMIYAILFAIVSGLAFYLGIKYKDDFTRDMGIAFLLINLYTRYFEYFWDTMNKGIFFLILAITFGLLGRWLEKKKRSKHKEIKT